LLCVAVNETIHSNSSHFERTVVLRGSAGQRS
jgi:hypothetical protein